MKYLFFDIDGTLLDFDACEKEAFKLSMAEHKLQFKDEIFSFYHKVNAKLWEKHNKGLITTEKISVERFRILFKEYSLCCDEVEFSKTFRKFLGEFAFYMQGAEELLENLKGKYELYAVTNGVAITQHKRLKSSGLDKIFKEIFISEEIGVQKPEKSFFDYCFEKIENFNKEEAIIIGDSLSSDIKGGNNAGIKTCWFNRDFLNAADDVHIDYEISELSQIYEILGENA